MHILEHFEFSVSRVFNNPAPFHVQTNSAMDGILCADLTTAIQLRRRRHFHMHILEHFEFFSIEMA